MGDKHVLKPMKGDTATSIVNYLSHAFTSCIRVVMAKAEVLALQTTEGHSKFTAERFDAFSYEQGFELREEEPCLS